MRNTSAWRKLSAQVSTICSARRLTESSLSSKGINGPGFCVELLMICITFIVLRVSIGRSTQIYCLFRNYRSTFSRNVMEDLYCPAMERQRPSQMIRRTFTGCGSISYERLQTKNRGNQGKIKRCSLCDVNQTINHKILRA